MGRRGRQERGLWTVGERGRTREHGRKERRKTGCRDGKRGREQPNRCERWRGVEEDRWGSLTVRCRSECGGVVRDQSLLICRSDGSWCVD